MPASSSSTDAGRAELERIRDELERAISGSPWHGSSLLGNLENVTAAQAAARPIAGAHSIWELVLHVTGWAHEVARRVRAGDCREPDAGDWPPVRDRSDAAWRAAVDALRAAHEDAVKAVASMDPSRLDAPLLDRRPEAERTTFALLLHGLAQHDAYHSGQIALLRKALGGSKS